MRERHPRLWTTRVAAALPLLLAGPAWLSHPAAAQVLEVATDQSPVGLDPHVATAFSTLLIDGNIYEGLTAVDKDLRTVPALAESWTSSPDGLTYVFRMREGAKFHNGQPVTPADVIASIERVRDPKTGSPYSSRFTGIASMAAEAGGVKLVLSAPSAPLLAQLASLAIIPAASAHGEGNLGRQPVGTGPFKFRQWVPDTYIALDKFEDYWAKGLPHLAGLKFDIVPEAATRQLGLAGGTYRMLPVVDAATVAALQGNASVKILQTQDLAYSVLGLNASKPPFDKPEVREAVNFAIDRAQLVQAAYFGKAVPAGPLSPALKQWALPVSDFPCYQSSAAQAQALLKQAGITAPLKVTLNVLGSLQIVVDIAQVLQAQLNKAGFDVQLNVQEAGKFVQDWRASNFEAFVSLNSGGPDPDDYFGRSFQTAGATNVYKFSDAGLDKMLTTARATSDMAQRKALYDDAQKLLACRGPVVHLAYGTLFTALRSDMQGYETIATRSTAYLRDVSIGK